MNYSLLLTTLIVFRSWGEQLEDVPVSFVATETDCGQSSSRETVSFQSWLAEGNGAPLQYSCLENPMDRGVHRDFLWTSLVAQIVKCLPTMRETWVGSLGQEDPLENEMAIHSSTLAWKIPWMEEPGRLQSMGSQRVGHD